jgi:hypothetical protein
LEKQTKKEADKKGSRRRRIVEVSDPWRR